MFRTLNHIPFNLDDETPRSSERLEVDYDACLFFESNGYCFCGRCGELTDIDDKPTVCGNESCEQAWNYLVVEPMSPKIPDPWLTIYSRSGIKSDSKEKRWNVEKAKQRIMGRHALY